MLLENSYSHYSKNKGKMSHHKKKLLADFESDHIMMTLPYMHRKKQYYTKLCDIYLSLNKIFLESKINQTIVLSENYNNTIPVILNHKSVTKQYYDCDDIWLRDYTPKIYFSGNIKKMINYDFNAYGEKYPYIRDNGFKNNLNYSFDEINMDNFVLEGGNLEFSGSGIIITNITCINKNNKNNNINVEKELDNMKTQLEVKELFTIDLPEIKGDDTNGHIDNYVRFLTNDTIVYFASKDKDYCNYEIACELEKQIEVILNKSALINRAIPLYHSKVDELIKDGKIYPYSKLNFIASKDLFIFPYIYKNKDFIESDIESLNIKSKVHVINSEASLIEYGGLHCLTANI
tara:strand:+ start:1282 stop:2322 length:1041 start_codon:yes stop_codon:yes gene_type:complete